MKKITSGDHIFELVDRIPSGYKIWNIGKNMIDGYLPLVMVGGADGYQVVGEKKAIKNEGSQIILEAIGNGQDTIAAMEKYIRRYENAKINTRSYRQSERIKKALPYMYAIEGMR